MENKRNSVVLASAVFGLLFVIGLIVLLGFAFKDVDFSDISISEIFKRLFNNEGKEARKELGIEFSKADILYTILIIVIPLLIISAFVVNVLAWLKNNSKLTLISGILHLLSCNIFSAPLCLVEFADNKKKIKERFYFYVMAYTAILTIIFSIVSFLAAKDASSYSDNGMYIFAIYFTVISLLGLLFNILAWQKGTRWLKVAAGTCYLLSGLNIISAIFSFIYTKENKDEIKDKLFFHVLECTVILNIFLFILFISLAIGTADSIGFNIYFMITAALGILFNILAYKTGKKEFKIVSGVFYLISIFNIISAIFSFVYCKQNKKA